MKTDLFRLESFFFFAIIAALSKPLPCGEKWGAFCATFSACYADKRPLCYRIIWEITRDVLTRTERLSPSVLYGQPNLIV